MLLRAASGGRRRPLGHRARADDDVRDHDRRHRQGRRRDRPRRGPAARRRDRRADPVRRRADDPAPWRAARGPLAAFSRLGPRTRGDGFASGLFVGAALGFVYTPCAGPILATVISVSAASGRAVAVGLAYAVGTGLMLLVLALGGRRDPRLPAPLGRTLGVQRALGVVMVATAVALATMLDVKLDQWIARAHPERQHHRVRRQLLRSPSAWRACGPQGAHSAATSAATAVQSAAAPGAAGERPPACPTRHGPRVRRHRGLVQHARRPAADARRPARARRPDRLLDLHLHQLHPHAPVPRGLGCEVPQQGPDDHRRRVAGVPVRADASNVRAAIAQFGIHYPVVQDNNLAPGTPGATSTGRPSI